ncbi:hypothetical protein KJA16_02315 [Patescibacteria group bacterium]|nr:hypothetical protein [Patescibacteria group bacterium]
MKIKRFLIILIIGIVILFSVIGWMAWKGYQLQKGEVIIITDKTEYKKGEILRVKIKNNLWENICFSSCYPYLLERKNKKWESYKYVECHDFNGNGHCINVGKEKAFELTLPEVPDGLHRLTIPVCIGCKKEDTFREDKGFYSNEFTIKEKKVNETANWKTYRSEEYGFEIKYQSDWKYTEGTQTKPDARGYYIVAFGKTVPAQDYPFVITQRASKEEVIGTMYQKNSLIIDIWTWGPANPEEYAISQKMLSTFKFLE